MPIHLYIYILYIYSVHSVVVHYKVLVVVSKIKEVVANGGISSVGVNLHYIYSWNSSEVRVDPSVRYRPAVELCQLLWAEDPASNMYYRIANMMFNHTVTSIYKEVLF